MPEVRIIAKNFMDMVASMPAMKLDKLYENGFICEAILRSLPPLAKKYVIQMLQIDVPVAAKLLEEWVLPDGVSKHRVAVDRLVQLRVFLEAVDRKNEKTFKVNPTYQRSLQKLLVQGGTLPRESMPSNITVRLPTLENLEAYALEQWEWFLLQLISPAQADKPLNISSSLMKVFQRRLLSQRDKEAPKLTESGFQFLLMDTNAQLWYIIREYISNSEERGVDAADLISFMLELSFHVIGEAYSISTLTDFQRSIINDLADLGLVKLQQGRKGSWFIPTKLATNLSMSLADSSSRKQGFVVVETNFRVYAYSTSKLHCEILRLFSRVEYQLPNLIVGAITKESLYNAFENGITADQGFSPMETEEELVDPTPEDQSLPLQNGDSDDRSAKKPKVDADDELKRVAEIVLVLSTMATVRAGRKPSDAEVELMREARARLAGLCQGLAPKDIVAREAIGTVIEDLGLHSKLKDQRLGFRTPKMSIAERYSHAKWKMEEAKKFSAPSTTHTSQPLQPNISGPVDNRVPSHVVRIFPSDKSSQQAIPSMGPVVSIPPHVSAGSSAVLQYQSTGNEIRPPVVSGVMPSGHLGRNSSSLVLPKVEHPQFKVDGGSNGSSYMLQVQANSSANQPLVNAPTWSMQTHAAPIARTASENKVPATNSVKAEGTSDATVSRAGPQIATDQSFRPFITQTASVNLPSVHQPLQATNIVQPPLIPSHTDIAKVVQKVLLPKLPSHPTWIPPSRDYMNKALTCQMCELSVHEVDTVLLCDACEKGFHLKCLQPSVLRGIHNRVDWHCMRCLSLSGGKPLPPKYGRVMRSSNTPPKLPSNTGGLQACFENKAENIEPKVLQMVANGSTVPTVVSVNHNVEVACYSKFPDTKGIQGIGISSSIEAIDKTPDPNNSMKSLSAASSPSIGLLGECSTKQINSKVLTSKETSECESLPNLSELARCDSMQSSQDFQVEQTMSKDNAEVSPEKHIDSNIMNNNQKDSLEGENLTYDIKRDDQDAALPNIVGISGTNTEGRQHPVLSSDSSHAVDWIGDVVQLADEKIFYQSCCVDGVSYRLQGHALFPTSNGKLAPSKLQSMWEDCKTGIKWVKVTKCYFPDDLPGNIGHPCISEVNEVYESNSDRTEMAGSIQGPCEVLPSDKFKQENDRRCQLGIEECTRIQPIFLCRWFYDEFKKLFQPVIS